MKRNSERIIIAHLLITLLSFAGHPLNTEDGFTLGTGAFEVEVVTEFFDFNSNSEIAMPLGFSIGLADNTDFLFGLSYHKYWDEEHNFTSFNDIIIELKQMLFIDEVRFGVKPFISIPTGDHSRGFGAGKLNYGMIILLTKEWEKFHVHTQLGYTQNKNSVNQNENLWEYSVALEKLFSDRFSGLLEFGVSSNCCPYNSEPPKFISLGAAYILEENFSISAGLIRGIHNVDRYLGLTGGITVTF